MTNNNHSISITTMLVTTKVSRMVTYHGNLRIKSHGLLVPLHYEIRWQIKTIMFSLPQCWTVTWLLVLVVFGDHIINKNHYISPSKMSMTTKLGGLVIYFEKLLHIKSHEPLFKWSWEILWQSKNIAVTIVTYTTIIPMATKLGRMVR